MFYLNENKLNGALKRRKRFIISSVFYFLIIISLLSLIVILREQLSHNLSLLLCIVISILSTTIYVEYFRVNILELGKYICFLRLVATKFPFTLRTALISIEENKTTLNGISFYLLNFESRSYFLLDEFNIDYFITGITYKLEVVDRYIVGITK